MKGKREVGIPIRQAQGRLSEYRRDDKRERGCGSLRQAQGRLYGGLWTGSPRTGERRVGSIWSRGLPGVARCPGLAGLLLGPGRGRWDGGGEEDGRVRDADPTQDHQERLGVG